MRFGADQVQVVNARLETPRRLDARLRLERRAAAVDWRPPGLPPAAILCVRSLRAPPIGVHDADERAWGLAIRGSLADSLGRAARPEGSGEAEAVLFENEAHLLACLARDAAAGRSRWWWDALFPRRGLPERWPELWAERATVVPYAVARLVREEAWVEVVAAMEEPVAVALAEAVTIAWGLPAVRRVVRAAPVTVAGAASAVDAVSVAVLAPWVPPSLRGPGSPGRVALTAVVLGLVVQPDAVRAATWSARLAAVLAGDRLVAPEAVPVARTAAAAPAVAIAPGVPVVARVVERAGTSEGKGAEQPIAAEVEAAGVRVARSPGERPAGPSRGIAEVGDVTGEEGPVVGLPEVAVPPMVAPARIEGVQAPETTAPGAPQEVAEMRWPSGSAAIEAPGVGDVTPAAPEALWAAEVARFPPLAFQTRFGGVFYLLNIALALELYGDFTRPLQPPIGLGPWTWVDGVARRILGEAGEDPLWAWLADRVGPPSSEAPAEWVVPPGWLAPLDADGRPWAWDRDGQRSRLSEPYDGTWEAWLDRCAAYVAWRLAGAVPARSPADVLSQPARVVDALERIDVVFDLGSHPVEVRAGGLDRDPGWIPSAGVDVRFRFEGGVAW